MSQLCALADVQTYLGDSAASSGSVLSALITNASAMIEQYCNRVFAQASYTETRNGRNTETLYMRQQPIMSVQSLTIDGITVPASTNPKGYGYVFDDAQLYLRGARGPFGQPERFERGAQNIVVQYMAGFQTIPADVAQACIELVADKFAKRNRIDKSSETLGTQQTQAYVMTDMPARVKAALASYRVPMVPA